MTKTKKFRATVDPKFLLKVDRIFDASPRTIFNELLQNARRAKATEVTVEIEEKDGKSIVTIEDNGDGVVSPRPLLRLAGSEWDADTQDAEDPAGMGFFSLSAFESVEVWSRDWYGKFTPEVFCGAVDLTTTTIPAMTAGMKIKWVWPGMAEDQLVRHVDSAAEHCGIPIINIKSPGDSKRIEPKSFLHDSELVERFDDLGFSIGVISAPSRYRAAPDISINFNGVRIKETLTGQPLAVALGAHNFEVKVDVQCVKELQLVLPSRNALKHNAARNNLLLMCEKKVYEKIAEQRYGKHSLSFANYERALSEFGIDIGEALNDLPTWSCEGNWGSSVTHENEILVSPELAGIRPLFVLWNEGAAYNTSRTKPAYEGYKWYDALPRLTDAITTIDGQVFEDTTLFYESGADAEGNGGDSVLCWVNDIKVEFFISNGDTIVVKPDVLVTSEDSTSSVEGIEEGMTSVYLRKSSKEDPDAVGNAVDFVKDCIFSPSEDGEAEHYERQEREFMRDMTSWLVGFFGTTADSVKYLLEEFASEYPWEARADHYSWTITCSPETGAPKVTSFEPVKPKI